MKWLKFTLLAIIVLDIAALALLGFFELKTSLPLNNFSEDSKVVTIESGSGLEDIAAALKNENVLKNTHYFIAYAWINDRAASLKAGSYTITPDMSIKDITDLLAGGGPLDSLRVTIPEGFDSTDIADKLAGEGVIASAEGFLNISGLSAQSAQNIFDNEFLSAAEAPSLEGFLFPDTYDFHLSIKPEEAIGKLLDAFETKAWPVLKNGGQGQAKGYSTYEHLITASLLEKEVQTEEDMKIVAGIVYNRMEIGMPLQIDATLAFLTGKSTEELINADKEIDSPYNTYQNRGLPPAPIANPGLKAISSALDPTPNNYLYYLTGRDGTTHFAETLDEHNENKRLYLR